MAEMTVTFDGGVPGQSLVAGENDIDSTPDSPVLPVFENAIHGVGVRTGSSVNTTDTRFRVGLGGVAETNHSGSIYLKCNALPASSFVVFVSWVAPGNTIRASLRVGSNRALNIRVGASTIVRAGSANEVPLSSWFRFDWQISGTTVSWRLYNDPDGTTATLSGTFSLATSDVVRLVLGANSSNTVVKDFSYDTVRAKDGLSWYAPYVHTSPGPTVTVWNGTTEVAIGTLKVWNGTTEVAASIDSIV